MKKLVTVATCVALLLSLLPAGTPPPANAQVDWSGTWEVHWNGGGLTFDQVGPPPWPGHDPYQVQLSQGGLSQVTGISEKHSGGVVAQAVGATLTGTGLGPAEEEVFEVRMSADGRTFSGNWGSRPSLPSGWMGALWGQRDSVQPSPIPPPPPPPPPPRTPPQYEFLSRQQEADILSLTTVRVKDSVTIRVESGELSFMDWIVGRPEGTAMITNAYDSYGAIRFEYLVGPPIPARHFQQATVRFYFRSPLSAGHTYTYTWEYEYSLNQQYSEWSSTAVSPSGAFRVLSLRITAPQGYQIYRTETAYAETKLLAANREAAEIEVRDVSQLVLKAYYGERSPAAPAGDWTGHWDTNFGEMCLTQVGNQVTGSYAHDNGRFVGTVSGNILTGTWSEEPSYKPPKDAGDAELTLSADGSSLTGRWRYGSSGDWSNDSWDGERIDYNPCGPAPTCDWTGTWDTNWDDMDLSQVGNEVTGTYDYQGGRITGTVSGDMLTGTWSEEPSYKPTKDAGDMELTMAADCNQFEGRWRYGSSGGWDGTWYGVRKEVQPNQPPTASFRIIPPRPTTADIITAQSTSTDPDGDTLTHSWSLDGWRALASRNSAACQWAPLQAGEHTIMLVVDDTKGGADTCRMQITVGSEIPTPNNPPNASFTITPQSPQAGDSIMATSTSTDPDGDPLNYSWFFDDESADNCSNAASCQWGNLQSGQHTIILVVDDGKGGSNVCLMTVTLPDEGPSPNNPPVASFFVMPQNPQVPATVTATSMSTDPDGNKLSFNWFLDQAPGPCGDSPSCQWANLQAGTYTLTLVVNDGKRASATDFRQVTVGGGGPVPPPPPPQPWPPPQPQPAVNRSPTARFSITPQDPQAGDTVKGNSTSSDPDGDILTYSWFLDGNYLTDIGNSATWELHNLKEGNYMMKLEVKDGKGGQDEFYLPLTVGSGAAPSPDPTTNRPPKASFTMKPAMPKTSDTIKGTSTSSDPDGDPLTYSWFLDGNYVTEFGNSPRWEWRNPQAGGHSVTLVVDDGKGGTDKYSAKLKVAGGVEPDSDDKPGIHITLPQCFIATAAYGTETAEEIDILRDFRDEVLMQNAAGKRFVDLYYRLSPPLADFISEHEVARTLVREMVVHPIVEVLDTSKDIWTN